MLLAIIFLIIFLAILSWNAVIYWYLKRYIVEDDRVHHSMITIFSVGNAVFVAAIILLFLRVSWSDAALFLGEDILEQIRNVLL